MTASLAEVRDALAAAVTDATDLRCQPYLRAQINPPEAQINIAGPEQRTMSATGAQEYTASIVVYDQMGEERSAQIRFDELRDPFGARSLKRAIDDSTDLTAVSGVSFGEVGPGGDVEPVSIAGADYLRVVWPVAVWIHHEED